jgi:TPR repeat protein
MEGEYAKATRILRPIAEQGDASAQYLLAVIYMDGLDGSSNPAEWQHAFCPA